MVVVGVDQTQLISSAFPLIGGGTIGFGVGYVIKKLMKLGFIGLGLIMLVLGFLEYKHWISVNWTVTQRAVPRTHATTAFVKSVELRHLDGVKGNFGVSDSEYIAISTTDTRSNSLTESKSTGITIPHAVYSNVIENVQQQQYIFESGTRQRQLNKELEILRKVYNLLALESWKMKIKLSAK